MNIQKATRKELKDHNRLTLLRAVYYGLADNRAALAQLTGLAKPTVSDLIGEWIAEGLLEESGHGESNEMGGKRPRLLVFVPDARQVIGISIDAYQVCGVLSNLGGQVTAEHYASFNGAVGEEVFTILTEVINALVAQLDAPLLCIGVGMPGVVDNLTGVVQQSAHLGWRNLPLAKRLRAHYDCPVYVANTTELTALAQFAFNNAEVNSNANLVTVLVNNSVEIGVVLQGAHYHHGGDIGGLCVLTTDGDKQQLEAALNWKAVQQRINALRSTYPNSSLPDDFTYMHIRYAAARGDALSLTVIDQLAAQLAEVVAWSIMLLHPHHVSLAGGIVELGDELLARLQSKTAALLTLAQVEGVNFSLAEGSNLSARGAVALAIQNELDIL